jgi:hypothetical protein
MYIPPQIDCFDHNRHTVSSDVEPAVDIVIVTDQSESMAPYYRDALKVRDGALLLKVACAFRTTRHPPAGRSVSVGKALRAA